MSETRSSTLCIGAKTYNLSQVNSVSVQWVESSEAASIWTVYIVAGFVSLLLLGVLINVFQAVAGEIGLWIVGIMYMGASIAATAYAIYRVKDSSYKLFRLAFDMSSGNVTAFETRDEAEAFRIKDDIVKGLETGSLPDYLRPKP
jgi:hypothetical protein